ncbi:MAG: nucleotidyltransferase family protein [Anaerolineae bacterium]|nr:nucleotidyltransferase family protein [Anaerolineae bacterium]
MKAVIMAGGRGSRLRKLTTQRPKPMLPLLNKPVLAHLLNLLKHHQITDVVITVRYLAEQIKNYFGDGRDRGMAIQYAIENSPLGTAGSVKNAESYLGDEPFLVISGDAITDFDLSSVLQFHRDKQAAVTMVLKHVADPLEYGVVVTDAGGRIRHYLEKPDHGQVISNTVNTGIYVLEPEVLAMMKPNEVYDFSYDIFPRLLSQNIPLFGYLANGYWCDIGTIQRYRQATHDALVGKVKHIDRGSGLVVA